MIETTPSTAATTRAASSEMGALQTLATSILASKGDGCVSTIKFQGDAATYAVRLFSHEGTGSRIEWWRATAVDGTPAAKLKLGTMVLPSDPSAGSESTGTVPSIANLTAILKSRANEFRPPRSGPSSTTLTPVSAVLPVVPERPSSIQVTSHREAWDAALALITAAPPARTEFLTSDGHVISIAHLNKGVAKTGRYEHIDITISKLELSVGTGEDSVPFSQRKLVPHASFTVPAFGSEIEKSGVTGYDGNKESPTKLAPERILKELSKWLSLATCSQPFDNATL